MDVHERKIDTAAGSRMHVLDWLESPGFLPTLRELVASVNFVISDDAPRQPKGRSDHRESELVGRNETFLSRDEGDKLCSWWLVHRRGARLPTWDLVVAASDSFGRRALILVEAKAHAMELSEAGKLLVRRRTPEQRKRSDANHQRIAEAIAEATMALRGTNPKIALSRDRSYQFANRIAFAWKLASLGVPVALLYLGFLGDRSISSTKDCFLTSKDWMDAFHGHAGEHLPVEFHDREIRCGAASFWLLVRELQVLRQSPPLERRRLLR